MISTARATASRTRLDSWSLVGLLIGQRLFRHITPQAAALSTQWLLLILASLGLLGWWQH